MILLINVCNRTDSRIVLLLLQLIDNLLLHVEIASLNGTLQSCLAQAKAKDVQLRLLNSQISGQYFAYRAIGKTYRTYRCATLFKSWRDTLYIRIFSLFEETTLSETWNLFRVAVTIQNVKRRLHFTRERAGACEWFVWRPQRQATWFDRPSWYSLIY